MRPFLTFLLVVGLTAIAITGFAIADEDGAGLATADAKLPAAAQALVGGEPLPSKAMTIVFPWMGKQSVMCIGDSVERQIAFIDFGLEQNDANESMLLGSVAVDAKGVGTGSFAVAATALRSGAEKRDTKLMGGAWLDAESNPNLTFKATKMERKAPTVWHIEGTWTMRGVTKPVSFWANARYIAEMKHVGEDLARIQGAFEITLSEHNITNPAVGTAAVSDKWIVDVVLLGKITD